MSAKFQPGDVVRWMHPDGIAFDRHYTVKFCGDHYFVSSRPDGSETVDSHQHYELVPPPLPEPYIGYTDGHIGFDGVPTVYPLSIFHGSDTFYDSDLYEVEVRYVRKVDTRRPF